MPTPSLPFKFTKTYGISLKRGTIFTAKESASNNDSILVSWPAAEDGSVCVIAYPQWEVTGYLDKAQWLVVDENESEAEALERARWGSGMNNVDPSFGPPSLASTEEEEEPEDQAVPCASTVADLRTAWKTTIHGDGGDCPVCERFGKVYSRTINETMAQALKWLVNENDAKGFREWIDVPNTAPAHVLRGYQLTTLRWWGLVERQMPDPTQKGKKHSGHWRATLTGMDFVDGRVEVPSKVFHYNGDAVGFGPEMTDFKSCLKRRFNYEATMQTTHVKLGKSLFPANDEQTQAA